MAAPISGVDLGAVWPPVPNPNQVNGVPSVGPLSNLVATTGGNTPTTQPVPNVDKIGNSTTVGLEPLEAPQVLTGTKDYTKTVVP